jgi:catechol 2,3-dioxygenase-like lactoylglutathione lyase family enzyme
MCGIADRHLSGLRVYQALQSLCYGQMVSREESMRPKTDGILESSLYVSDLPRSVRFYEETFGFCVISDFGGRGCAMHAGTRQVLQLFKKGASRATKTPHDGDGELHVAFGIPSAELAKWEAWLQTRGIAIEEKRTWELGGWSLYFRDPVHTPPPTSLFSNGCCLFLFRNWNCSN